MILSTVSISSVHRATSKSYLSCSLIFSMASTNGCTLWVRSAIIILTGLIYLFLTSWNNFWDMFLIRVDIMPNALSIPLTASSATFLNVVIVSVRLRLLRVFFPSSFDTFLGLPARSITSSTFCWSLSLLPNGVLLRNPPRLPASLVGLPSLACLDLIYLASVLNLWFL